LKQMKQSRAAKERNLGLRIGVAIRRYRELGGLTQAALAAKAGVSQAEVSLIERGERSSLTTLDRVSLALGTRLSDIVRAAEDVGDLASVVAEAREFVRTQRGRLAKQRRSPRRQKAHSA